MQRNIHAVRTSKDARASIKSYSDMFAYNLKTFKGETDSGEDFT